MIAFAFILWHVFHTRGWFVSPWWIEHVTRPLGGGTFDSEHAAATAADGHPGVAAGGVAYVVGVLAASYHLANGLWTMGITWGVWTSPHAQRWANILCAWASAGVVGLATLWACDAGADCWSTVRDVD